MSYPPLFPAEVKEAVDEYLVSRRTSIVSTSTNSSSTSTRSQHDTPYPPQFPTEVQIAVQDFLETKKKEPPIRSYSTLLANKLCPPQFPGELQQYYREGRRESDATSIVSKASSNFTTVSLGMASMMTTSTAATSIMEDQEDTDWMLGRNYEIDEFSVYLFPYDEKEKERLTTQHNLLKWTLKSNFKSPVQDLLKNGARVLDIGCGPGDWLLDMATMYPTSTFHGLDLSSTLFPSSSPNNTIFTQANLVTGISLPDEQFDFIFQRGVGVSLTEDGWKRGLHEIWRLLRPGGFVEIVECEMVLLGGESPWNSLLDGMISHSGGDVTFGTDVPYDLNQMDFTNIKKVHLSIPSGKHGKQIGIQTADLMKQTVLALKPVLMRTHGIPLTQMDTIVQEIFEELDNGKTGINVHVVYAQKP